MSKGAKGEKSLKKIINKDKLSEEEKKHSLEGSLEINKYIRSIFNNKLEICKIIDCRVLEDRKQIPVKNEYDYEYYVHYLGFNRRNDKWIQRKDIIVDDEKLEGEVKKFKDEEEKKNLLIRNGEAELFLNDENEGLEKNCIVYHEEATKVKTIEQIVIGKHKTETWYFSPFPEGYHEKILYFCEFCLHFYVTKEELERHTKELCKLKHPPGNEIYRDGNISMFEVDGKLEQFYCENLCYLSKLFLDHKTLQWDVDPFLFYVLCEYDKYGYHFVGYFSKEKESAQGYNLACILVLPFYQRSGYGKFLMGFSYLLSQKEHKIATPERPLSDLGFNTYFSYWTQTLCKKLLEWNEPSITIDKLAEITSIKQSDIKKVLEDLHLLRCHDGQHLIIADKKIIEVLIKKAGRPGHVICPEKLLWTPYRFKTD